MIKRLIHINQRINKGFNSLNWLMPTITGSSLIAILLTDIGIVTAPTSFGIVILSVMGYYWIGALHEKHEKSER